MNTLSTIKTYDIRCRVKVNVLDGTFEVSSPVVTESNEAYVEAAKDKHAGDEDRLKEFLARVIYGELLVREEIYELAAKEERKRIVY